MDRHDHQCSLLGLNDIDELSSGSTPVLQVNIHSKIGIWIVCGDLGTLCLNKKLNFYKIST